MTGRAELGTAFLRQYGWGDASREFLQGDASSRLYERLSLNGKRALFVDSPEKSDPPLPGSEKSYTDVAKLARNVTPFVAIAHYLGEEGFTVPKIIAADLDHGFLILEDLGTEVYGEKISRGDDMDTPYIEAINVLLKLAELQPPRQLTIPGGGSHVVPDFDCDAFLVEAELLSGWFWKWLDLELPQKACESFQNLWRAAFAELAKMPERPVLNLRDYHSPNLIWCEDRQGLKRAGLIDFQDAVFTHPAYDLVSLLQDARTDIPPEVEDEYKSRYLHTRSEKADDFDTHSFELAYALLGAQRNTKILGIFARLALRDGKPHYLAHIPRVLSYLERCLAVPGLESLKAWYDTYLPSELRDLIRAAALKADIGQNAIVLSAGLGKRMAPLSDHCPKPLIKVAGKPLIEYALEKLADIGAHTIVVNVHYLADQIEDYIKTSWEDRENIIISDERTMLLETGGGVKKALSSLGSAPFFVINSDSIWLEDTHRNLPALIEAWDGDKMDCLILLARRNNSVGYTGKGDFDLVEGGQLKKRQEGEVPYVVSGTYLIHPRLFESAPDGPFSMTLLWDKALDEGRLYGLELEGTWLHIGTPEAVEESEKYISG